MKKILTLLYTNFIMLTRQRGLIISSLGLAIISMLVFGFLFGGSGSPKTLLGVVDQDHSTISAKIVSQLQKSDALQVYIGSNDEEQQALKEGHRNAIIVIPPGFGQQMVQGGAHLQVFYDQGNPVTTASTQLTVKAIVDGINRAVTHQPGPVTLDQQAVAAKDIRQIDIITPGMLGMLLMWANLAVGIELVNWREMGITKRLAATPLQPLAMISAQVVARLALSLIQGIILLAVSFPMMFLGGSYFDVNGAPSFLQPLIHAMPLYYLNEALRQVINNGAGWGSIQTGVLVMLAWIVASMLVVWRAFKWL